MAGDERPPSSIVRSDVGSLNASNKPTIENTTSVPITADALASAIQYHIRGTISDGALRWNGANFVLVGLLGARGTRRRSVS
jgi:hypothetical protein